MDKKHKKTKLIFKILGIILLVGGLACVIAGMVDFFGSIGKHNGAPKLFWLFFVGFPLCFAGATFTMLGFKREMSNYVKNEDVPVVKDIYKSMNPEIRNFVNQMKNQTPNTQVNVCKKCGTINDIDDKFCKKCGEPLEVLVCPNCGERLDPDAIYCQKCGTKVK